MMAKATIVTLSAMIKNLEAKNDLAHKDITDKIQAIKSELLGEDGKEGMMEKVRKMELEGVMKRRDLIVAHFEKLIAEKGENEVLY